MSFTIPLRDHKIALKNINHSLTRTISIELCYAIVREYHHFSPSSESSESEAHGRKRNESVRFSPVSCVWFSEENRNIFSVFFTPWIKSDAKKRKSSSEKATEVLYSTGLDSEEDLLPESFLLEKLQVCGYN